MFVKKPYMPLNIKICLKYLIKDELYINMLYSLRSGINLSDLSLREWRAAKENLPLPLTNIIFSIKRTGTFNILLFSRYQFFEVNELNSETFSKNFYKLSGTFIMKLYMKLFLLSYWVFCMFCYWFFNRHLPKYEINNRL